MRPGYRAGLTTGLAIGGLVGLGAGIEFGLHLLIGLLLMVGLTLVTATLGLRTFFKRRASGSGKTGSRSGASPGPVRTP